MKVIYFCFLLFFLSSKVYASCNYVVSPPAFEYSVGEHNPVTAGSFSLTRNNSSDPNCARFFVAFTTGWSNTYNRQAKNLANGDIINYNLYKRINLQTVLKGVGAITSNEEIMSETINNGETKQFTYYFSLVGNYANANLRAGTYVDFVQLQTYTGTYNDIKGIESNVDLAIRINVAKYIALSLVDSGAAFDETKTSKVLDFDELEENKTLAFDIRVVSNSGYILKASSANNGQLKRVNGSGVKSLIAYDFLVNNNTVSMGSSASSPVTISSLYGTRTPQGGAQIPVKIKIKNVTDKDPGDYQDYITLSVISTN